MIISVLNGDTNSRKSPRDREVRCPGSVPSFLFTMSLESGVPRYQLLESKLTKKHRSQFKIYLGKFEL